MQIYEIVLGVILFLMALTVILCITAQGRLEKAGTFIGGSQMRGKRTEPGACLLYTSMCIRDSYNIFSGCCANSLHCYLVYCFDLILCRHYLSGPVHGEMLCAGRFFAAKNFLEKVQKTS